MRLRGLGADGVVTDPQSLENARRVHPQLNYELDRFAALAELGWRTTRSFAEACRDAWAWQSANPQGYGG